MDKLQTIRVLTTDDHPLMRAGIVAVFNAQPDVSVIAEATDGEEAISLYRQYRPDVALMRSSIFQSIPLTDMSKVFFRSSEQMIVRMQS